MDKKTLISLEINNIAIEDLAKEEIKKKIHETPNKLFYDMQDLEHLTSFSKGHIMNTFFYDSRFESIRKKVGAKHVFPAKETKEFLLEWIKEQPTN